MKKLLAVLFCIMLIVLIFPVQSSAYEKAVQASVSHDKVFVNECMENMQSYNIGGYNYFKLRDIADAFRNTSSEFDVIWNAQKLSVEIITGKVYTPIEQKEQNNYNYYTTATPCESELYIDGQNVSIQAYTIEGYNYFKLRDLAEYIPFDIKWDGEYSFIFITTHPIPNSYRVESLNSERINTLDYGSIFGYSRTSHIIDNGDGTITVIDGRGNGTIIMNPNNSNREGFIYIATYDENFSLLRTNIVERELEIYGGFYKVDDHYYIVFGQNNLEEDDSKEVFRVVKYSKDFKREGSASVYGKQCITTKPFKAGCTRMAHNNNLLVIHSSRERYTSSDKLNHQSNITIEVYTDNMTIKSVSEPFPSNHVSHSFNQFIQFDKGKKVFVDHGDGYPRSAVLQKESSYNSFEEANMLEIYGQIGENYTGVTLGGFELSETKYLLVGSSVTQNKNYRTDKTRNIFVSTLPKNNIKDSLVDLTWITNYSGEKEGNIYYPKLVKISDTLFMVLWQGGYTDELAFDHNGFQVFKSGPVYYAYLDEDGKQIGDIQTIEYGQLSDCDPIYANGRVVWYSVGGEMMTFFTIPVDER